MSNIEVEVPKSGKWKKGLDNTFSKRRTKGIGDRIGHALQGCRSVKHLIKTALHYGVKREELKKYETSELHIGIVRMLIGNKIRAAIRHHEARELERHLKRSQKHQVLS